MSKASKSRDSCCCCIPIKAGIIVLTCLHFIGSIVQLVQTIGIIQDLPRIVKEMDAKDLGVFIRSTSAAWYAPYVAFALIDLFACILGFWSVSKGRAGAFKLYFGWRVVHIIFLTVMTIVEIARFAQVIALLKSGSSAVVSAAGTAASDIDLSAFGAVSDFMINFVTIALIPIYIAMVIAVLLTVYFLVVHKRYLRIMQQQE